MIRVDLTALIATAEDHARETYKTQAELAPLIHVVGPNGEVGVLPFGWNGVTDRARMIQAVKGVLKDVEASAYLLLSETWMIDTGPDPERPDQPDLSKIRYGSLAEHPDRVECLMIMAVARTGEKASVMYALERGADGLVSKLVKRELPGMNFGGDLMELFGPTVHDDAVGNA